jgi:hypothetical protein
MASPRSRQLLRARHIVDDMIWRDTQSQAVLFWRTDAQASRSQRGRRRSCGCDDREVARARLMIATSIGRNEVVVDLCRSPDIQTRLVLSQRSQKRRPSLWRAREPTVVIDIISCQIRFMVGIPRQRGTPCSARPQYENSSDCSCPVHTDTSLYIFPSPL